ncbi:hypothetical protein IGI04_040473 [Brassica rapa subsp. trilocularis]|uniref:Uncharacterized protein n=1 Tax=Brassica rapa subsp. trilocularis TaxID=1813537 RepID=A0ABQ7KMX4_BRACM|nr:hypothetical protein IGI04_040473 [Brassica rapa subsp. trilocularis]
MRARSLRSDRATLFGLFSDVLCFFRKALLLTSSQPFLTPTVSPPSSLESWIERRDSSARFGDLGKDRPFNISSSQGGKRSSDVEMGEVTSPVPIPTSSVEAPACVADHLSFREKLALRAGTEFPSSSALVIAPDHGTEVKVLQDAGTLAGTSVPDTLVLPAGSSTTPILIEDKERAAESMHPPPVRKVIPKGRKRKFPKGGDGESSQQGGSSLTSGLRGKVFVSLIDWMTSECGSEASRLSGQLTELQGRWSETEAMLTSIKDSHSTKVSKLEVEIGELERDLGKTVSSLLKEVHRSASHGIREAEDALRYEFQARLAKISAFLGSLEREGHSSGVPERDSPVLRAEETRLSDCKGDLAALDGDFDLVLADLKSACFLPTCSEDPEGKDPVVGEYGGDAAPILDEAMGEEGA